MSNSKKLFNIEKLEILVLNDISGSNVPLVFLETKSTPLMIEQSYMKFLLAGNIQLQISYYNLNIGRMEPYRVIEKFNFDLILLRNHDSQPRFYLSMESGENQDALNINIHQNLVNILGNTFLRVKKTQEEEHGRKLSMRASQSMTQIQKKSRKLIFHKDQAIERKINNVDEQITLLQIENYTGYKLDVYANDQQKSIESGSRCNFTSHADQDIIQSLQEMKIQKISFDNLKKEKFIIRQIHLDQNEPIQYNWFKQDIEGFVHIQKEYFICYCYIHQSNRVFFLSSSLIVENKTQFTMRISAQKWSKQLTQQENVAFPSELINDYTLIKFCFEDYALQENKKENDLTLANLKEKNLQVQLGSCKIVVCLEKDPIVKGRTYLRFNSPVQFKNCLPVPVRLVFEQSIIDNIKDTIKQFASGIQLENNSILMDCQSVFHFLTIPIKNNIKFQLLIEGFHISEKIPLLKNEPLKFIILKDETQLSVKFYFDKTIESGSIILSLYSKTCLLNTTLYQINYFTYKKDKKIRLPGQRSNFVLLDEETDKIQIEFQDCFTNEVSIKGIGDTSIELKKKNKDFYELLEFGIYIKPISCGAANLFTKIIEISPRYVIFNTSQYDLQISQDQVYAEPQIVYKDERATFYWKDCRKEKMVVVRPFYQNKQSFKWSGGFYINEVRTVNFFCMHRNDLSQIFFKATMSKRKGTFYVMISEVSEGQYAYKFVNKCEDINIYYSQKVLSNEIQSSYNDFYLPFEKPTPFAWPYPNLQPILVVKFQKVNTNKKHEVELNLFQYGPYNTFTIQENPKIVIYITIQFDNQTKIVQFQKYQDEEDIPMPTNPKLQELDSIIYISIPSIAISMISSKVELNVLSLRNLEFTQSKQNSITSYRFRVDFLQIDNNSGYDVSFPVLLTPLSFKQDIVAIDLGFSQNNQQDQLMMIEKFLLVLTPLNMKLDEEYLRLLLKFIKNIQQELTPDSQINKEQLLTSYQTSQLYFMTHLKRIDIIRKLQKNFLSDINLFQEWQIVNIPKANRSLYIKELIISPVIVNFTFQKNYIQSDQFFLFTLLSNAFGTAISNVEDAPIRLIGFKLINGFDTTSGIIAQLKEHYTFEILKQMLKVIGSIEIIGNPISLFNRISAGVVDMIEKPIEGFYQGPIELGLGIVQGTTSLLKNAVAGTFYSINKITGGIATQVSMLSMDQEYLQRRRKFISQKPSQFVEGVGYGILSVLLGVGDGFYGIIQQPYIQGREGGLVGVLKGSAIGMTGLLVKPAAGVLDAASKTAEGLTNTATYFDDKPNQERMRNIRVFYEREKYYKNYKDVDGMIMHLFQYFRNGLFKDVEFLDSFILYDSHFEQEMFLVLTFQKVIYLSKKYVVQFEVDPLEIKKFKLSSLDNSQQFVLVIQSNEENVNINRIDNVYQKIKFKKNPFVQQIQYQLQYLITKIKQ